VITIQQTKIVSYDAKTAQRKSWQRFPDLKSTLHNHRQYGFTNQKGATFAASNGTIRR
jgi:hypothetical protein